MKKSKLTQLTALMFAAALAAGCQNPLRDDSNAPAGYGSAPEPSTSYAPSEDAPAELYGPPVQDAPDATITEETAADTASGDAAPFSQTYAPLYGPPEDMDMDEPEIAADETVTETLGSAGRPSVVYGPPNF